MMTRIMTELILASGSPWRLQLLREAGIEPRVHVSQVEEPALAGFADLEAALVYVAHLKAREVARAGVTGLILAADTVSRAQGELLGKAASRAEARHMLESLSGTEHDVLTGWCVLRTTDERLVAGVGQTILEMRRWSEAEIEAYLDSGEWEGKCGAYGLQMPNDPFVTRMIGSAANVIGLPMESLLPVLKELDVRC
jgi:septum formation protein